MLICKYLLLLGAYQTFKSVVWVHSLKFWIALDIVFSNISFVSLSSPEILVRNKFGPNNIGPKFSHDLLKFHCFSLCFNLDNVYWCTCKFTIFLLFLPPVQSANKLTERIFFISDTVFFPLSEHFFIFGFRKKKLLPFGWNSPSVHMLSTFSSNHLIIYLS